MFPQKRGQALLDRDVPALRVTSVDEDIVQGWDAETKEAESCLQDDGNQMCEVLIGGTPFTI